MHKANEPVKFQAECRPQQFMKFAARCRRQSEGTDHDHSVL